MLVGIIWAVLAGTMLGLYALPEKFTKEFEFENTWGMMFFINMIIVPILAGLVIVDDFGTILSTIPLDVIMSMVAASLLWGIGVMMWGKAIDYIGLSLGFSIFIGTVILVGSLLPFLVDGFPAQNVFLTILGGIFVVLLGVIANGKAGIIREQTAKTDNEISNSKSTGTGILIAIIGGLLATGFSYANAAGRPIIHETSLAAGNPEWVTAVIVMFIIYIGGAIFVIPYFIYQLTSKNLWKRFKTTHILNNTTMVIAMAVLNFTASASFAYAAFLLGKSGNTVGYAIFNTVCVAVAILSGIFMGEWSSAANKAKRFLYFGLVAMIIGVIIIAIGNGMN